MASYKKDLTGYLVLNGPHMPSDWFLKRVIVEGLKEHRCENCKLFQWLGAPIPLERHHIDGNNRNNVLDNLQLLCPNCHALTPNYRGRNKDGKSNPDVRRKDWPTKAQLTVLVAQYPVVEIAKRLSVARGTVRYWLKMLGVKKKKRGYWHSVLFKESIAPAQPLVLHPFPALASGGSLFVDK